LHSINIKTKIVCCISLSNKKSSKVDVARRRVPWNAIVVGDTARAGGRVTTQGIGREGDGGAAIGPLVLLILVAVLWGRIRGWRTVAVIRRLLFGSAVSMRGTT
jgi:hypothetical protein